MDKEKQNQSEQNQNSVTVETINGVGVVTGGTVIINNKSPQYNSL